MDGPVPESVDLLVVGGGINGAGIARDAAGRRLRVLLVEQDDLGSHTSSASSKLIHGGLRYLEHYKFRLVAEALAEREVMLKAAPHLVRPMRFVMPHVPQLRPAWMIRTGLLLYDYLARRATLAGSHSVNLRASPYGAGLKPGFDRGFVYSDCRVDDSRLVVATARAAALSGAVILTRTRCVSARRANGVWHATLRRRDGAALEVTAQAIANVAGPWVRAFLHDALDERGTYGLKLIKGSHIVVPRLYEGDHAYILQNDDRRVIFVYAYEDRYSVIGTTDVAMTGGPDRCTASAEEVTYLCRAVNRYFARPIAESDVVWSYCGVRPLFDDGSTDPSAITRDYVLRVDAPPGGAPVLSVFGGKITTYRALSEHALAQLQPWFSGMLPAWTAGQPLPGGDLSGESFEHFSDVRLKRDAPWLPAALRQGLARRHGALAYEVLGQATSLEAMGAHFGADLYAREVDYLMTHEWALDAEDILWRRTKAGLHLKPEQCAAVKAYVARRVPEV
jgi:glycerol-3-phosphate dehydrogenase